jgi:uncharacterized protein (DUF305 family)
MQLNIAITAFAGLLIGFGAGSLFAGDRGTAPVNTHQMSDISMMSDTMSGMMARLEAQTGAGFDRVFIEEMIVHHEAAVDMAELALEYAERREIRNLATDIITAQTSEITKMRNWLEAWF